MAFQVSFGSGGQGDGAGKAVEEAQKSGKLSLVARGLEEISEEILSVNEHKAPVGPVSFDQLDTDVAWYEKVPVTRLLLNSNSIKQIPDGISRMSTLVSLDCAANEISHVSAEIGKLTNLTFLSLANNHLPDLPPEIGALSLLASLKLDSNQLTQIGGWIGALKNLTALNLRGNKLTSLPDSLGQLTGLVRLDLSHNQLPALPPEIGALSSLQELICCKNKLSLVPDLTGLKSLESLDLSLNGLLEFPRLPEGAALKEVNLAINKIRALPAEAISHLSGLTTLQISENALSTLPENITTLSHLQRLDCSSNNLTKVPYTLGHMPLSQLSLQGNLLKDLRPEMLAKSTEELLAYLVSKIPIEEGATPGATALLPDEHPLLQHLRDKRVARLNGKGWEALPADLVTSRLCPEAKEVDLSKNKLSAVPDEFFLAVGHAEGLQLQFNRLSVLPLGVCGLRALNLLQLFNNKLCDLPPQLSQLSCLADIRIGYNRFTELPKVLYQIPSLNAIVADNNEIDRVDAASLQQLPQLSALDLSNNSLRALPPQLSLCPSLRSLLVQGNLFKVPGNQVLDQGSVTLLEWLRGRIPQ